MGKECDKGIAISDSSYSHFFGAPQKPSRMLWQKYQPYAAQIEPDRITATTRTWADNTISKAPRWCSVDLRDGNQALIDPMNLEKKLKMWNLLVKLGFKEIEVGFPAASQTDYDFIRLLIEQDLIPDDVVIGVLTQARDHLITKTYECLKGAKQAYVHLYNSTSILQRDVVFNMTKEQIIDLAVQGAKLCKSLEHIVGDTVLYYEYSPESFTGTELDFAASICNAVIDVFAPSSASGRPVVVNLPSTVEMTTPNVYADQVQWMAAHLGGFTDNAPDDGVVAGRDALKWTRDDIVISLHPHNDQGMGVAAAHLGLLAGADRVEGCLFGNGERTGNVDLITVALNLFSVGVDPELDITDIKHIRQIAEYCTDITVGPRHPYAGSLVFTAFSGSHQDAIKKGLERRSEQAKLAGVDENSFEWKVPYLPIDPLDIGASYESVIRVNSQSGKGGIAYILKSSYNLDLPKRLQIEFSSVVQKYADQTSQELQDSLIYELFCDEYLPISEHLGHHNLLHDDESTTHAVKASSSSLDLQSWGRLKIVSINDSVNSETNESVLKVQLLDSSDGEDGAKTVDLVGVGNGPIDAFINAIGDLLTDLGELQILDYAQHALSSGQDAKACSYIECRIGNQDLWGVGIDPSTTKSSLKAIISAVNRAWRAV